MPNYSLPWDCPENWRKVWGCQAGKEWGWNLWSWTQVMPENKGSKPSLAPQGWSSSHILVSPQQGCLHRWGGHPQQVCLPAPSEKWGKNAEIPTWWFPSRDLLTITTKGFPRRKTSRHVPAPAWEITRSALSMSWMSTMGLIWISEWIMAIFTGCTSASEGL